MMTLVLTASIGTIGANSLALGPMAPALAVTLQTDTIVVMRAAIGYGLGTAAGALFLSPLIDRFGVQRTLRVALAGLALTFAASALAPSVVYLILAQSLAGLAAGVGLPAIYAFAALIAPTGQASRILGRVMVGWTLSLVAGVSLSALVADVASGSWVYAAFALLTLSAFLALSRARVSQAPREASTPLTWPHRTLHIDGVPPLLMLCFGYMLAFYGCYGFLGDHIASALNHPLRLMGLITLAYGIGFGLAVWGDPLIDRMGVQRALPWAFATLAVVYAAMAMGTGSFAALLTVAGIWGAVNHFGLNLIIAGLSAIDPNNRGAILGAYSATTYLAASVGTFAFGAVYINWGFSMVAWLAAGLITLATAFAVRPAHL